MDWGNEAIHTRYKGFHIFVSKTRPAGEDSFRTAYTVVDADGALIMLGSTVGIYQYIAFLQACETTHEFVDSLLLPY